MMPITAILVKNGYQKTAAILNVIIAVKDLNTWRSMMSRSRKKPYGAIASGRMNWWKADSNRIVRRSVDDIPDGRYYRRINDIWDSPSDGKCRYINDEKAMRK